EIQGLFENPLLVRRICRGVIVALDRMINLVGQRERELAIRIDMENEDGAFGLAFVLRYRYAPDVVCAVQLIHDLLADRGDLRNAVGREDRMSIRPGVGAERERTPYAAVHDGREVAGDDVCCVVGRQIVGVITRLVVVVFVARAVCDILATLKMELFFLNDSSDRGEGEWSERLLLLDQKRRLFRMENDVR